MFLVLGFFRWQCVFHKNYEDQGKVLNLEEGHQILRKISRVMRKRTFNENAYKKLDKYVEYISV